MGIGEETFFLIMVLGYSLKERDVIVKEGFSKYNNNCQLSDSGVQPLEEF